MAAAIAHLIAAALCLAPMRNRIREPQKTLALTAAVLFSLAVLFSALISF